MGGKRAIYVPCTKNAAAPVINQKWSSMFPKEYSCSIALFLLTLDELDAL